MKKFLASIFFYGALTASANAVEYSNVQFANDMQRVADIYQSNTADCYQELVN